MPFSSDDATRTSRQSPQPGPGLVMTYRCDFCRLIKAVHSGRKRVRGVFWRCTQCNKEKA